jgi:hypothetical protein
LTRTSVPVEREPNMIGNRPLRRFVAAVLVILGGLLMWFAPPIWVGAIPFAAGFILEAIGIAIEHGDVT